MAVVGRGSLLRPSDEGHWEIVAPSSQGVSVHVQQAAFATASTVVPLHQQISPTTALKNKKPEEEAAGGTPTASNGAQIYNDEVTLKPGDTRNDNEVGTRAGHTRGGGGAAQGITSQNVVNESLFVLLRPLRATSKRIPRRILSKCYPMFPRWAPTLLR